MASNLDLQEQEQLDELKAFWNQYGNLITWAITLVLAGFAAFNGWQWWQQRQAVGAAGMFSELDAAVQAGDAERSARVFQDMKDRFGRTALAQQAALLTAKVQVDKGQGDAARATLEWLIAEAGDQGYGPLARIRLGAVKLARGQVDQALADLGAATGADLELAEGQFWLGRALLAKGEAGQAVERLKRAVELGIGRAHV